MASHCVAAFVSLVLTLGCASSQKPGPGGPVPEASRFPANVGVQLYSLRKQLKADLPGTLAKVKEMELVDVELYDFHGQRPLELKKTLEAAGLRPRSIHQPFKRFELDVQGLIADAQDLGVTFVGCAWIPHEGDYDADENRRAMEVFTLAGTAMQAAGLRLFYHPHGYEFAKRADGTSLFDDLLSGTQPGVVDFEMDVFWMVHGGADPMAYLRKHPERFILTHLKDMRKGEPVGLTTGQADAEIDVALGTGQIDIAAIVQQAEKSRHVVWHFLEDESSRVLDQLPRSLAYLKSLTP